ncbi:hypothetical protein, partial [Pseudomonas savastanoi]
LENQALDEQLGNRYRSLRGPYRPYFDRKAVPAIVRFTWRNEAPLWAFHWISIFACPGLSAPKGKMG